MSGDNNRLAEELAAPEAGAADAARKRLAALEAAHAQDAANLAKYRQAVKTIRDSMLMRAGRMDELRRVLAAKPEEPARG